MSKGYRGYITSRPFMGERSPQHVQQLVIRDYCARNGFQFLLSATEYAMADCFMMLDAVAEELPNLAGVVMYSIFMLPPSKAARQALYDKVFAAGASLHGALEDFAINTPDDARRVEDLWLVRTFMDSQQKGN